MRKIFRYLKPYRLLVILALVLVLAQSFADLWLPRLMSSLVDEGIAKQDFSLILTRGLEMLAVTLAGAIAAVASAYCAARSSMAFGRDLRLAIFTKVEGFSLNEFDTIGTSTLITRTTNDVTQLQGFTQMALHMLARAPSMMIGSLILALSTDARLSTVLLYALPFLVGSVVFIALVGLPLFRKMQTKVDALNRVLREGLTGIRVIRAFNRTGAEQRRFGKANEDLSRTALKAQRTMMLMMPLMMLIMNLSTVAVVWFGSIRVEAGAIKVGELMAFIQYAGHILFSLMILSSMFVTFPRAQVSAQRINEVLGTESAISDPAVQAAEPREAHRPGHIEFRHVSFRYPGAEEYAIKDLSVTLEPGETAAVIGGTGAGKTTLVSLLLRFYDVTDGAILLDGIDIRSMSQASLRSRLALVPQKTVLFSGSIEENLRFGKEGASGDELDRALRVAQATEFVAGLPEGRSHELAQGGTNLSGGQRQRLAIARALTRNAELYIFDDSFSALDFRTDARLRAELPEGTGSATVLIVAQRVGTVMGADSILVLDEGRLAGKGHHDELLDTCPVYREIVASQFQGEAI